MAPTQYIEALGRTLGTQLVFSEEKGTTLRLGGRTVKIIWNEGLSSFILAGEIAAAEEIPTLAQSELYGRLLSANHQYERTNGALLSLEAKTKNVWINRRVRVADIDTVSFIRAVNAFLSESALWRERLLEVLSAREQRIDADQKRLIEADMVRASIPELQCPVFSNGEKP